MDIYDITYVRLIRIPIQENYLKLIHFNIYEGIGILKIS